MPPVRAARIAETEEIALERDRPQNAASVADRVEVAPPVDAVSLVAGHLVDDVSPALAMRTLTSVSTSKPSQSTRMYGRQRAQKAL